MKMHCDVIQDLIPSYVDGICREKTKELVEEHLLECEQCRAFVESLKTDLLPKTSQVDAKKPWQKVKRRTLLKILAALLIGPVLCLTLIVGWCTLSGEGLTLDALLYRHEANAFLHHVSDSDYAKASEYLSCYGSEDVGKDRAAWTLRMEELDLEFESMQWAPLYGDDGLVMTRVTAQLSTGERLEFRVMVQGDGLSISSIYVYGNETLQKMLQEKMTSHNPG